ncbi:hypothetical protein CHU98_g9752 [Xylaria longipes]|nr:hypothetical protein CHU98_g9752 [Xylaria longipes]
MKAWLCAETVYEQDVAALSEEMEDSGLKIEWSQASSTNGNIKATTLTTFVAPPPYDSRAEPTTYLIIAVRGSASTVDHLVNLNGEPRDARQAPGLGDQTLKFLAHAGFLNSARELLASISTQIEKRLSKGQKFNILFTGHSAGGAVATLLHLALRVKFAGVPFSCITFGSPPVAKFVDEDRIALDRVMEQAPVLNIVNEYDLVPRLDAGYLRSLLRLYNSGDLNVTSEDTLTAEGISGKCWPLPPPDLQHIGPIVVLKTELPDLQLDSAKPPKVSTRQHFGYEYQDVETTPVVTMLQRYLWHGICWRSQGLVPVTVLFNGISTNHHSPEPPDPQRNDHIVASDMEEKKKKRKSTYTNLTLRNLDEIID